VNRFARELGLVERSAPLGITGRVRRVRGMSVRASDLPAPIGSLVALGAGAAFGEVVGFEADETIVMLLSPTGGIVAGMPITLERTNQIAPVGDEMLGRVVDGLGRPIDAPTPIPDLIDRPLDPEPVGAMRRARIDQPLRTGVRVIDLMTPVGRGQRLGIFAGPGVGKSTLLGQIARGTDADVNVIALVGERGREVREFIEHALGPEGLARSVVVVATGDESPLMRIRASKLACAAAEHFRDHGRDVLLMMDSITRFAHAQRQIGLSVGEPPATRGYTPSVFSALPELLERAGAIEHDDGTRGSITGLYTILVEGDDMTEPVADAARGILDGHVMLSRRIAHRGQFPAVDVLDSVSRVASHVADEAHISARQQIVRMVAAYREVEELVQIGAYAQGSDPQTDTAIDMHEVIDELLAQRADEASDFDRSRDMLVKLALQSGDMVNQRRQIQGSAPDRSAPDRPARAG